jgi:putative lipoprotein (rSAM/lipoprotein system)
MKSFHSFVLKSSNRFISYILGLMEFAASCIPEPIEYGMPHATFKLKGTVKADLTELPLPNIKIFMDGDSTITATDGTFEIDQTSYPEEKTFIVRFVDFDGNLNGNYKDIDTTITFENPKFVGGDGKWDHGVTEKELDIKLEPTKNAE